MPVLTIQFKRSTAVRWASVNPILSAGEPGLEMDTGKVKYGDGSTRWNDLPYSTSGSNGGGVPGDISDHINSPTPHPVYDDMQSLVGLYENAKV